MEWTNKDTWKAYIAEAIVEADGNDGMAMGWIDDPRQLVITQELPDTMKPIVDQMNTKITSALQAYETHDTTATTRLVADAGAGATVTLLKMKWDWVLCYGEGNFFDFESIAGKVCMIGGANASGKSSIMDIICIGLFGQPSSVRTLKSRHFSKLANDTKPDKSPMVISILFRMNALVYEITRTFSGKDKTACVTDLTHALVIVEGITAVDAWITNTMGTLDQMMMSNMFGQINTSDHFIHMKQEDQKNVLDKVLRLDTVTAFGKVIKEAHSAHTQVLQHLKTAASALTCGVTLDQGTMSKDIEKLARLTADTQDCMSNLQTRKDVLSGLIGSGHEYSYEDHAALKRALKSNRKKLDTFNDLTDEDKEKALLLKGEHYSRWRQLQDKLTIVGSPAAATAAATEIDIETQIASMTQAIESMLEMKPSLNMSEELVKMKSAEYAQWLKQQPESYITDPDMLEETMIEMQADLQKYKSHLEALYENPISKPVGIKPAATAESAVEDIDQLQQHIMKTESKLEELKDQAASIHIPRMSYDKWMKEYAVWKDQVQEILDTDTDNDTTLKELEERYEQYLKYITVMEEKTLAKKTLQKQLEELQRDIEEVSSLPFNKECWACQKQPMRIRQVQLTEKMSTVKKSLSKVVKYLATNSGSGDGEGADLREMKSEAKALKVVIEKRGYYDATYERMMTEKKAWDDLHVIETNIAKLQKVLSETQCKYQSLLWTAYEKWNTKVRKLRIKIAEHEEEIARMQKFLGELPRYVTLREMLKRENAARSALEEWEEKYTTAQTQLTDLKLELDRIDLKDEIDELESIITVNTSLLERLKLWEQCVNEQDTIEKRIAFSEYVDVSAELASKNKLYIEQQSRLMSLEKLIDENTNHDHHLSLYTEAIKIIEQRKQLLSIMETKFVGDRCSSDGFKEYIYQTSIIPTFTRTVNEFLERCTDIRLDIAYQNKTFVYTVHDRGCIAMFDMTSGYQKFIIGLAIRAALAKMQAIGNVIKHMFIDEGFVACDDANLQKTNEVLKALREFIGYDSIILISHSEAIQKCADIIIIAKREKEENVSVMRWGAAYPSSPVRSTVPKKRAVKSAAAAAKPPSRTLNLDEDHTQ
jgi:DNA repair exonuclease SbcCD ATPase subunit